jgi:hypothetical protein
MPEDPKRIRKLSRLFQETNDTGQCLVKYFPELAHMQQTGRCAVVRILLFFLLVHLFLKPSQILPFIFATKRKHGINFIHSITADEFFATLRSILKQEIKTALQQDQLLTKEGALKRPG